MNSVLYETVMLVGKLRIEVHRLNPTSQPGRSPPSFRLNWRCHNPCHTLFMPPSSHFNSSVPPYNFIRVDNFSSCPDTKVALHLLTHCHSDHLLGLDAKSFNSIVFCSNDTKLLVLNIETYAQRFLFDQRLIHNRKRPYKHLSMQAGNSGRSRDLLVCHSLTDTI